MPNLILFRIRLIFHHGIPLEQYRHDLDSHVPLATQMDVIMRNFIMRLLVLGGGFLLFQSSTLLSSDGLLDGTAEEAGLRIAIEARERQKGFENFTASLTMVLRNKKGQESVRELHMNVIETEDDGDRTRFVFDRPADVKGTAFLIHAFKNKPDRQWLYLPALKRVKSISASKQSGSFMGSEFSYEDMGAVEVEKFDHRYLGNEPCGEYDCLILERVPTNKDSGYSRQLVWLDREELRSVQVQYFDRREQLFKTMISEDYEKYLDRIWRAGKITMTNHLTGKDTTLLWSGYEFGTDLDLKDFTKTALKRIR